MKNIITAALFLWAAFAKAQDVSLLEKMCAGLADACVTLDYTYTARISGIDNNAQGTLVSQDDKWTVKGSGLEMFCDGSAVWVIDPALKEAVIEPVAEQEKVDLFTNPARIVMNISDSFNVNVSNGSADGRAQIFSLRPKEDTEIEYLNVEIWKDSATVRSMSFAMKDGTLVTIKVSSMKLTPKVSDETFKPRFVFDSKWLVTDLR